MKDQALYLEADEDITSAIDKLVKASGTAVQIVVPKRSTLLQSIINLKLLKKAASDNGKELVLVTSDKVAGDLAARLGLAVAPSLGAKAVIGDAAPRPETTNEDVIEADEPAPPPLETATPSMVPPKEPSKRPPLFKRKPVADKPVTPPVAEAAASTPDPDPASAAAADDAPKPSLKSKVPNFGKLQKRLLWVVAAVVIVVGYLIFINITGRATVALSATGTKVAVDTNFTLDPNQSTSNITSGVLAAQTVTLSKDATESITPTGTQDQGTQASGQMTVSNGTGADQTLVAGTRFQAPDGKIFKSNADIVVPKAYLDVGGNIVKGTKSVVVTADSNGDSYNEAPAAYTIPALNNPKVTAQGAQMSGGTTKTVTVVPQDDLDKAQTDLINKELGSDQKALAAKAPAGYTLISALNTTVPSNLTSSPVVNQAATGNATVTVHLVDSEYAVKTSDYQAFLHQREQTQIGASNQIYDDGFGSMTVANTGKDSSGRFTFSISAQAYSGAKIDTAALAKSLAGMKYGDATDAAAKQPGVQHVSINLSPSWLTSLPHNAAKIKVTIQVASDN